MADIIPFRGILYNNQLIKNPGDVTTPPYDVISKQEQFDFYESHPNNIIRLILGKSTPADTDTNNAHTRAAGFFINWLSEGILVQDEQPAFYFTSLEFEEKSKSITRYGLIALVGLEPFEKGIVLPHEKTFSRVKSERLRLMKKCHTNFSPIFSLYSDNGIMKALQASVLDKPPHMDFFDTHHQKHKLWKITDPDVHHNVASIMQQKQLFIADGHHRYETALNYRSWVASNNPDFSATHPANYVMMYLSSMEDPGLLILPAHRMVSDLDDSTLTTLPEKAAEYFDVEVFTTEDTIPGSIPAAFVSAFQSKPPANSIGLFMKNRPEFFLMTLKPGIMENLYGNEMDNALLELDVTVLTRLFLMDILGFDQAGLDNEGLISYTSSFQHAVDSVLSGKCDLSFLLNPTRIEQVRHVAAKGLIMPRKSTYFYPKVITGQVINKID